MKQVLWGAVLTLLVVLAGIGLANVGRAEQTYAQSASPSPSPSPSPTPAAAPATGYGTLAR